MGEFDLINRYFKRPQAIARVGIGDDCAILTPYVGYERCVTTDLLIEGHHFLPDVAPAALGHKALAVNLSDLAAMGAQPSTFTLALGLPKADEAWVAEFARGMFALADAHACHLIGGDTTASPIVVVSIAAMGLLPMGGGVLRSGAQPDDDIWVSGTLGDGALGLAVQLGKVKLPADHAAYCVDRVERPRPRIALGLALANVAHSMMDLSDGLAGDLPHILAASRVSARVDVNNLPLSDALRALPLPEAQQLAANGGDDYELLFTAPPGARNRLQFIAQQQSIALTRIGVIESMTDGRPTLQWFENGRPATRSFHGFEHFAA